MKKGIIINTTILVVAAILMFIVRSSYEDFEVGAYALMPDGREQLEEASNYRVLRSYTDLDAYGVRFTDAIFFDDLNEVSFSIISTRVSDEDFLIRMYDFDTLQHIDIIRTGTKSKLYHAYENIYAYLDNGYQGAIVVEVIDSENKVLERMKFWVS